MTQTDTLAELGCGQRAIISAIVHPDPQINQRMRCMGLRCGQAVQVVRRSRWGGPIQVRSGNTDLLIRPQQAAQIQLRAIEDTSAQTPARPRPIENLRPLYPQASHAQASQAS